MANARRDTVEDKGAGHRRLHVLVARKFLVAGYPGCLDGAVFAFSLFSILPIPPILVL